MSAPLGAPAQVEPWPPLCALLARLLPPPSPGLPQPRPGRPRRAGAAAAAPEVEGARVGGRGGRGGAGGRGMGRGLDGASAVCLSSRSGGLHTPAGGAPPVSPHQERIPLGLSPAGPQSPAARASESASIGVGAGACGEPRPRCAVWSLSFTPRSGCCHPAPHLHTSAAVALPALCSRRCLPPAHLRAHPGPNARAPQLPDTPGREPAAAGGWRPC